MKKLVQIILCLGLLFGLMIQPPTTFAKSTESIEATSINIQSVLTNNETEQNLDYAIKDIKRISYQEHSDGAITESYEVVATIPVNIITPNDQTGGSIIEADCKATLNITYFMRNNNQEIRITNISGGWEPQNNLVVVSNREASVTDGAIPPFNKVLRRNPTSNSFNYNTGWDYGTYYPGSDYTGARGYTEATLSVPGMGGSYNLFLTVAINR